MAGALLVILAITRSCSVDLSEKKEEPAPEPAPVVQKEEEPKEDTMKKGRITTEFRYEQVKNDTALHSGLLPVYHDEMDYQGERPADLESVYSALFDGDTQICAARTTQMYLTSEALEKFTALVRDLKGQTGAKDLMIYDGYVPYTGDTVGNEFWADGYEKTSDCGEHFLGTSVDLLTVAADGYPEFTGEGKHKWLLDNMANYGFILRYPEGKEAKTSHEAVKNHLRYVAYPASKIIANKGWCLEEFIEEVSKFTYKDQLVFTDTHGGQYCLYYVKADTKSRTTNIPVPIDGDKELKFRISGDGKEGYIVSCMVKTPDNTQQTDEEKSAGTDADEQKTEEPAKDEQEAAAEQKDDKTETTTAANDEPAAAEQQDEKDEKPENADNAGNADA